MGTVRATPAHSPRMQAKTMQHKRAGSLPCRSSRISSLVVRCSSTAGPKHTQEPSRRDALLLGTASLAAPFILATAPPASAELKNLPYKLLPVKQLGSGQKTAQREQFVKRVETTILKYLSPSDATAAVRLALLDAGDYEISTKTGGANGSIVDKAPADVQSVVEKLRKAKADIDSNDENGNGAISWADLIYLAGKVTTQASWKAAKEAKSGAQAVAQSGNAWPFIIGRVDSDVEGPNKVPSADASVEEITAYLKRLGAKPGSGDGPFAGKPPFWEKPGFLLWCASVEDQAAEEARFAAASRTYADVKRSYDMSRETISRTDYEVDFAAVYNKMTSLGASIDKTKYLYPEKILAPRL